MGTNDRVRSILNDDLQRISWDFFNVRVLEYLITGFKGRMVLDIQDHRIGVVLDQAAIAGLTQMTYYLNKSTEKMGK